MRFELDRGRLLDLLVGHTIYNDPTVAIRELLQNAIDAVRFKNYLTMKASNDEPEGEVTVRWSPPDRILSVSDNGTGMNLETIQKHLLRVGSSFYDTDQFQNANKDFTPISRFGIGVLTCFMVSDDVEIVTCRDDTGWRIKMSQVQADYLLKELPFGDPLLAGLEPHGTRVTLRLRPLIDLSKRSVLDIVRHWVLLPSCKVSYRDDERTESIGFVTAAAALRKLLETEEYNLDDYEFLTVSSDAMPENELAFAVRRSFFPERVFVNSPRRPVSATCIEGIRADGSVPGFKPGLAALLSIRGNRRFRTTVSRANLERDAEYDRVADICTHTLFSHVGQEIERISSAEGRPLSQASSTGRWVAHSLSSAATPETSDRLNVLLRAVPLVVVEETGWSAEGQVPSSRNLRSLDQVQQLESFWAVESRTVDYLNTISRDVGTDINISQFVRSLAPTLFDERITPLIPDIEKFSRDLLRTHCIYTVEVSRRHQRSIMQWKLRDAPVYVPTAELAAVTNQLLHSTDPNARMYGDAVLLDQTFVLSVSGDLKVDVVQARSVSILDPQWSLTPLWKGLIAAYGDGALTTEERALAAVSAHFLVKSTDSYAFRSNSAGAHWLFLYERLSMLLQKLRYAGNVPANLDSVPTKVFNASQFWRNWDSPDGTTLD
jgi:hypothetical protein